MGRTDWAAKAERLKPRETNDIHGWLPKVKLIGLLRCSNWLLTSICRQIRFSILQVATIVVAAGVVEVASERLHRAPLTPSGSLPSSWLFPLLSLPLSLPLPHSLPAACWLLERLLGPSAILRLPPRGRQQSEKVAFKEANETAITTDQPSGRSVSQIHLTLAH